MGYIKKEKIEEIKLKSDIVSVVSDYLPLTKSGKYFLGRCPFHNEKTPSFFVYPDSNNFHCFGCGKHGNSISFLMDIESMDYVSALTKLAEKFGVTLEFEKNKVDNDYAKYYYMNDFVAKFYYKKMLENPVPKKYLADRGISQKSINTFLMGYADSNWKSLTNELKQKNLDLEIALELGLIIKTKSGDYIDRFRDRIMFPIVNKYKRIIGFGGRTIVDDNAKYLNSPESVIFKKGENLYAIDKVSDRNIRDKILIVEGYMDVISLYQQGINYAVAGLGTALTENQARLARQYSGNNVYICYDADTAGINAANKAYSIFENISINPKMLKLPDKLDPDDFIKKYGNAEFENLLKNSYDIYDFNFIYFNELINKSNGIKEKLEVYNKALAFLNSIVNNLLKETFIKKFSEIFEVDIISLKKDLENFEKKQNVSNVEKDKEVYLYNFSSEKVTLSKNDKKILILGITLLMRGNKDIKKFVDNLFYLSYECDMESILQYVFDKYEENILVLPSMLIDKFKSDDRALKIVDYIIKLYESMRDISFNEFACNLELSKLDIEIKKVTRNIELLRSMEQNSDVIENLNKNIQNLMNLNKNAKNLRMEKGVHCE